MSEKEKGPETPEPTGDPGHVLPQEIWDKVEAERERLEKEKNNG